MCVRVLGVCVACEYMHVCGMCDCVWCICGGEDCTGAMLHGGVKKEFSGLRGIVPLDPLPGYIAK